MKKYKKNKYYNYQALQNYDATNEQLESAYFFATEVLGLSKDIEIEIIYDGLKISRISAILGNNTGYDFTKVEIERWKNSF